MNTWVRRIAALAGLVMTLSFTACGGGGSTDGGDTDAAPTISTQPASTSVTEGADATFSVVATGTPAPTYQWQRNGVDVAGATSSSLTVSSVTAADSGAQFRVVVTNSKDSVPSAAATLTVNSPPAIVSQPVGATVNPGKPANFLVVASGTGPLSYQWQRDGIDIAGATSASYSLASAALEDDGAGFRVVVSNGQGTATSNSAALSVTPDIIVPPTIVTQPQSVTVVDGAPAILSVAAAGTGPFRYQWRKNGTPVVGATSNIYTTDPLTPADSGTKYSVVVSDNDTSVTSDDATVTVNFLPLEWLVQPAATSVAPGQVAVFVAGAFGSQPVTYQWKRNGADIAGATNLVYTTPATTLADNGALYSVVATNPVGSITSTAALLTVGTPVAPSITTAPASLTVNAGQVADFSVTAAGTAPLSYQWLRNGVSIAGATTASYSTPATTAADNAARFSVRVTNAVGSVTSAEAVLTVQLVPSPLDGRAWTTGQPLETDDNLVRDRVSGIDDAGRVTVVFRKNNGTRDVIYATRGTPNAAGTAPTWSAPVAIDLLAGTPVSTMSAGQVDYNVVVAPGGNALAYWYHTAPCSAATYSVSGSCRYHYLARYTESGDSWSTPELIGDASRPAFKAVTNDRGDIALFGTSWIRSGTRSSTAAPALFSRSASQATLSRQLVNSVPLGAWSLDMDASGNLLLAAEAQQNATTDLVAYRGTAASGLGSQEVLDTRGAAATLLAARLGLNGQQVVTWQQNNGTAVSVWAAASGTASGAWAVQELAALRVFGDTILTVADNGDAQLLSRNSRWRWGWVGGTWAALTDLPLNSPDSVFLGCSHARNGNFLCIANDAFGEGNTGRWASYDASRNAMVQPLSSASSSGFILGLNTINRGVGYELPLLSVNGVGATTMLNRYDVLPTAASPAGDSRTITNLWGVYLK